MTHVFLALEKDTEKFHETTVFQEPYEGYSCGVKND